MSKLSKNRNLIILVSILIVSLLTISIFCYQKANMVEKVADPIIVEYSSPLAFSSGDGSSSNPFMIVSATDMNTISADVASGHTYENVYFKVVNGAGTISLGNFTPIGGAQHHLWGILMVAVSSLTLQYQESPIVKPYSGGWIKEQ